MPGNGRYDGPDHPSRSGPFAYLEAPMARIQILHLPADDQYATHGTGLAVPFALVIDQVTPKEEELFMRSSGRLDGFAKVCGARGTLVVTGTLDVA
ncbi:hypothetical protein GCM10010497_45960 [Streptomyces cinereoruber]|uniref:Uncharacterized protein n=1 Tax=Streptomyces cinereoruber TaxID=67260 RepID=A0AAV4KN02_9ACTN|nr:hypothetical protein [Streptomyces cinereoruber]MBB4160065.1 hypothetical protein [Streptomyces cinereoruber]MBY8818324.1 hypothetical protein [Streptomyces cinereoruber]NIH61003.1 hypothetical protein [Streptomyces cinereoruber]QEV33283.1 hypothetical protein CP977_14825 [Streptomyces cinereoruber]GGR37889.1 hypothetical protein GCM10010497_45960 [Streptomyces cinereoruber]